MFLLDNRHPYNKFIKSVKQIIEEEIAERIDWK